MKTKTKKRIALISTFGLLAATGIVLVGLKTTVLIFLFAFSAVALVCAYLEFVFWVTSDSE